MTGGLSDRGGGDIKGFPQVTINIKEHIRIKTTDNLFLIQTSCNKSSFVCKKMTKIFSS